MIQNDQPNSLGADIAVGLSSIDDGNMKKENMPFEIAKDVDSNRQKFLSQLGIGLDQTVLVRINYDRDDFTRYSVVSSADMGSGILPDKSIDINDALMTSEPNIALFLPLADCVGAVLYEPSKKVLMVSHLGRHNLQQNGAYKSVQYMSEKSGIKPADIKVWLSPSAGKENYPLHAMDNKSQQQVVLEQLEKAGITSQNIDISNIDTTIDDNYYSHSQYLKDHTSPNGRFAIVAMIL